MRKLPHPEDLPDLLRRYHWKGRFHERNGYPADCFPEFRWIRKLEEQFGSCYRDKIGFPPEFVFDVISWGGGQHGLLKRFQRALESDSFNEKIQRVVAAIDNCEEAIGIALSIPSLGLTYTSKILRFLNPYDYGALDKRLRDAFQETGKMSPVPRIYDGKQNIASMIKGFRQFTDYVRSLRDDLNGKSIAVPGHSNKRWTAGEVEMALFCWASEAHQCK